ncbi:MAG: acylphosphatase [Candidatus Omnitrophica bacterium]|nr:acylphosphatase [Candidatus Omnitrophota bacterium]
MPQAHILYTGRVQGVGFRYTVQRIAVQAGLCGWVRNLSNGGVEILVEGDNEDIERLMQEVDAYFDGYIRDKEVARQPSTEKFKDFQIVF